MSFRVVALDMNLEGLRPLVSLPVPWNSHTTCVTFPKIVVIVIRVYGRLKSDLTNNSVQVMSW